MMQSENIIDMKNNSTNRYIPSSKKCPKLSFSVDFLVGQDSRLPELIRTHPECQDKKPLDQIGLSSCSAPDSPPSATPSRLLPTDPESRIRVSESSLTQTRILPAVGSEVFCARDAPEQTTVLHPGHHLSTGLLSGLSLHQGIFWPAESVDTGAQGNPFFNQQWWAMAQVKQQQERLLAAAAGMHRFQAGSDFGSLLFPPYRKAKRIRTAFSPSQLLKLEQAFEKNHYVVGNERKQLAQSLNLSETQVKVWFQNRRTKQKRIQQDEEDGGSSSFNGSKEESSTVHQTDSEISSDIDLEDCEDLVK